MQVHEHSLPSVAPELMQQESIAVAKAAERKTTQGQSPPTGESALSSSRRKSTSLPPAPIDIVVPANSNYTTDEISPRELIQYPFSDTEDSLDDIYGTSPGNALGSSSGAGGISSTASPSTSPTRVRFDPISINNPKAYPSNNAGDDSDNGQDITDVNLELMKNEKVVKSGWMKKKGEKRKRWKRRWFVLRATKIAYYKNEREYELLHIIHLENVHAIAPVERKKRQNVFGVVTKQRTYFFQAFSPEEMEEWMSMLRKQKKEMQNNAAAGAGGAGLGTSTGVAATHRADLLQQQSTQGAMQNPQTPQSGHQPSPQVQSPPFANTPSSSTPRMRPSVTFNLNSSSSSSVVALPSSQQQTPSRESSPVADVAPAAIPFSPAESDTQSRRSTNASTNESLLTVASTPSMQFNPSSPTTSPPRSLTVSTAPPSQTSNTPTPISTDVLSTTTALLTISVPAAGSISPISATSPAASSLGSPATTTTSVVIIPSPISPAHPPLATTPVTPGTTLTPILQRPTVEIRVGTAVRTSVTEMPATSPVTPLSPRNPQRHGDGPAAGASSSEGEDDADVEEANSAEGVRDDRVVCQGYLQKQGTKYNKSWKRRWFVLRNARLCMYKNDREYVVTRMIGLRKVLDIIEIDPQGKSHVHCFKVVLPKRSLILCAETRGEMQEWIVRLKEIHAKVNAMIETRREMSKR
ncbi:hypothetical protein HK102_006303, partial [Quaeritorhiza haematococci]